MESESNIRLPKNLIVTDLYEAAAIEALSGVEPSLDLDGRGWILFSFPANSCTIDAQHSFVTGGTAALDGYIRILRRLRGRMMAKRGSI